MEELYLSRFVEMESSSDVENEFSTASLSLFRPPTGQVAAAPVMAKAEVMSFDQ